MGFILANNRKIVLALALLLLGGLLQSGTLIKGTRSNINSGSKKISYPALKIQPLPKIEKAQKKHIALKKSVNKTKISEKQTAKTKSIVIPPMPGEKPRIINPPISIPKPPHEPIIIGE